MTSRARREATRKRRRRKRWIVDLSFQSRYSAAWLSLAFWIVFALTFFYLAGTWLYLRHTQTTRVWIGEAGPQAIRVFVVANIAFVLVLIVLIGVTALLHSHRIAGACYRLRSDMARIREGDRSVQFRLRRNDFLQELAVDLNETIGHLRSKLREQERNLELVKDLTDVLDEVDLPESVAGLAREVGSQIAVREPLELRPMESDSSEEGEVS